MPNIIIEFSAGHLVSRQNIKIFEGAILLEKNLGGLSLPQEVLLTADKSEWLFSLNHKTKKGIMPFRHITHYREECLYSFAAKALRKVFLNQAHEAKVTLSHWELEFAISANSKQTLITNLNLELEGKTDVNAWGKAIKLAFRRIIQAYILNPNEALLSVSFGFDGLYYSVFATL